MSRAAAFREGFAGVRASSTPARPSCARRSLAGSRRRGSASTCAPAASWPSPSGPASRWSGSASTATTRPLPSSSVPSSSGVGRIIVDSFHEIERLAAITGELGRTARVMVRVTAGVEAHTHEYIATAHEDQKFGFSISSGDALDAVRQIHDGPRARADRPALATSAPRSSTPPGFEVAARRVLALHAQVSERDRRAAARARPRRRLRHRLHHPGRPLRRRAAGHRDDQDRARRVRRTRPRGAARCRSSPVARSSGRPCAPSTRSAPSRRSSSTAAPCAPTSRSTAG